MKKLVGFLAIVLMGAILTSCNKENSNEPSTASINSTDDAAYSISSALSSESAGLSDQVGDAFQAAFPSSVLAKVMSSENFTAADTAFKSRVWNETEKAWYVTVERTKTSYNGKNTIYHKRLYKLQYLNKANQYQKAWLVGSDTAYTILFKILNGKSHHENERLDRSLDSLTADLTITNANKTVVTMNGNVYNAGSDTLINPKSKRTLTYVLKAKMVNVLGPRQRKMALDNKIGGSIEGNYSAFVTFQKGENYSEKTINKDFTVSLDGTGGYNLNLGGFRYVGKLGSIGF